VLIRLEPVNTDPVVSPRKPKKTSDVEKHGNPTASTTNASLDSVRMRIKERKAVREELKVLQFELPKEDSLPMSVTTDGEMPPKTPGILDILSPLGSQPSTGRIVSKDTPPPASLTTLSSVEAGGRGSRRARAAVNYAEPNLISKMRRPTKELVDAVSKDGRPVFGAMVVKSEDESDGSELQGPIWKPMSSTSTSILILKDDAPSPLGKKSPEDAVPRASSSLERSTALTKSESRKRSASTMASSEGEVIQTVGWSQDLSIFEFASSSPNDKDKVEGRSGGLSRRRSTMLDSQGGKTTGSSKELAASRVLKPSTRRRSMML
jgi:hypothetical protein